MKLVDQYIHVIGEKLPLKTRKDIKEELRTLLLDEIESNYGTSPTNEQIFETIKSYGNPTEVAARYNGDKPVIAPGLKELYFMLLKIILGAISIAFTTIFFVELFTNVAASVPNAVPLKELFLRILKIPLQVFSAYTGAIGMVSLVFVAISYFNNNIKVDTDWNPGDLQDVEIDEKKPSIVENIFSVLFGVIFIVLVLFFPEIISRCEDLFFSVSINLSHRINIEAFKTYGILFSFIVALDILAILVDKLTIKKTSLGLFYKMLVSTLSIIIVTFMLLDSDLYTNYTGIIGFKTIFLISLFGSIVELLSNVVKTIKYYLNKTSLKASLSCDK